MLTTGTTTRMPTTMTANDVSPQRTQAGSWRGFANRRRTGGGAGCGSGGCTKTASALMPHTRPFEEVDHDQHREGDHQQHDGDRRRLAVRELLEARHDQDRRNLRLVRHVAGHEHDRAVLA